jgi:TolB-like protein
MAWRNLLNELRRRGVYRICAAYVIAAFALLQGADIVLPALGVSPAVMTVSVVLAIAGLPVAAVLAWTFDVTPRGIERSTSPADGTVSRRTVAAGLAAVVGVSLIAGVAAWIGVRQATRSPDVPVLAATMGGRGAASVAVLPCRDLDADAGATYFGDGMTEAIIGELARFEDVKVISRTSVMALRDAALTLPQVADTLGVQHVLECSVQRSGERVRVRATLIDPVSDTNVWADAYNRELGDIVRIQEDIARQVGSALLARLPHAPTRAPTHNPVPSAYDAYLRGTAARRLLSRASLIEAVSAFEEAIAADSLFAPAYSGLSQVHVLWTLFGYRGGPDAYERVALGLDLAERAVALDSTLAESHAARAHAGLRASLPADIIMMDADRAVRLAPNSADAQLLRGTVLAFAGRFDEAVEQTAKALALDPLAPGHHDFRAMSLVLARRYDEALAAARTARALAPEFLNPIRQEARALLLLGRFDECAQVDVGPYLPLRAMCLHSLGRIAEARTLVDSLVDRIEQPSSSLALNPGGVAGDIAEYHAWTGDIDAALAWLRRSIDDSPSAQFLVHHTGTYDAVRHDPRFASGVDGIHREIRARIDARTPTARTRIARHSAPSAAN